MARSHRLLFALSAVAFLGRPVEARANGRFPASNAVIVSPTSADDVIVRVTFGLLSTRDGGKSWKWICERAIGFSGLEDPSYTVTKSGAIVAGLFEGLRVSRDHGCTWEPVPTEGFSVFIDTTLRSDGAVLALASAYDKQGDAGILFKSQLFVSTDDAKTFERVGGLLDPTLLAESVEVAPSDPNRVYVSAVRGEAPRQGVLLVSTDGGKKWIERKIAPPTTGDAGKSGELAPFIAGVDAKNPDRVYIRTSASPENPTRLLVTDDAGKTFRTLLSAKGPLLGFALSKDGKTVTAGGPDDGLFGGAFDAKELTKLSALKTQCLGRGFDGDLWACSNEASGFVAGTSKDDGASFAARLHLTDISGALECAPGTGVAKDCAADWPKMQSALGFMPEAKTDAGAAVDAGAPSSPPSHAPEKARATSSPTWLYALLAALGLSSAAYVFRRKKRD
ncbi:MAG: hypothetical protein JST00_08140 [Deltaproteobacteria bacterium]|nr:hypothetical protein [Deltaproteobacteria bacterium]